MRLMQSARSSNLINTSNPVNKRHPLNYGLTAWWMAIPGLMGGAKFYDLMGLYPGTLTATTSTTGWIGGGLRRPSGFGHIGIDTTSGMYVTAGTKAALDLTGEFTWTGWVRIISTAGNRGFYTNASSSTVENFEIGNASAVISLRWGNVTIDSSIGLSANVWTHVAVTRAGSSGSWDWVIYKNGVSAANGNTATNPSGGSYETRLGTQRTFNALNGLFDDYRLYKGRVLNAAEVWQVYTLSRQGYPGLLNRTPRNRFFSAGGSALTLTLSESLHVADTYGLGIQKALSEGVQVLDTHALGGDKALSEGVHLSDIYALGENRALSDGVQVTDNVALGLEKGLSESITVAELRELGAGKTLADDVTVTDTKALGIGKVLLDAMSLADAYTLAGNKGLAEGVTVTDFVSASTQMLINLMETIGVSDTRTFSVLKSVLESLTVTDLRTLAFAKILEEDLHVTDSVVVGYSILIPTAGIYSQGYGSHHLLYTQGYSAPVVLTAIPVAGVYNQGYGSRQLLYTQGYFALYRSIVQVVMPTRAILVDNGRVFAVLVDNGKVDARIAR